MKKLIVAALCLAMIAMAALASADAIKIGGSGPLTGPAADYGISVKNGAEIAVAEINAAAGQTVLELNFQDDEHDPEKAINAYNDVLDWGAQMIAGTVTTSPCIAVGAQAFEDRVFMLTPSASSVDVTSGKDNVYQVCFTDPAQGVASAEYISSHKLASKVAVIYNNADAYSTGIFQTFEGAAAEKGLEIVSVGTFTDDTTDFSVQVTDAKEAGAELVFLPIYYTPASMIFQQAKNIGYAPIFYGVDGMDGLLSIEGFDTSLAEGVMFLTPFASDANEMTEKFTKTYTEKFGTVPSQFAADGYDTIYALYNAAVKAGITAETKAEEACEKLIEAFQSLEVTGLTGTMSWDSTGAVTKTPTAVIIKNGVYVGADAQ